MRLRDEGASVRREEVLVAPREEVWSALSNPERLAEWFATEVALEVEPGGKGVFRWENGEERRALVHEVVDGERLAFAWIDEAAVSSTVELELEETPDGTRLTVTETAISAAAEPAVDWSVAIGLGALARHLEPVLV
jgi:uncharacterized protein YndB with AHSA1/START domain